MEGSCKRQICDGIFNSSICNVTSGAIQWNNTLVTGLYFFEFIVLLAVALCLGYLTANRNASLVKSWFSHTDNIILAILAIFCFMPLAHIGEISRERCIAFWPMVNTIYALYASLLMTKTIFLQNLLNCKAPTDKCVHRLAFAAFITLLHIIVLSSMALTSLPTVERYVCPTRGVITLCDVSGNTSIVVSTTFNWFVIFFLCILTLVEAVNNQEDFRRCKNQVVLALTVILSYSAVVSTNYFKLQLQNYSLVTHLFYLIYLIIPVLALSTYYLPTIYLVIRYLHNQKRLKKSSETDTPEKRISTNRLFLRKSFDPSRSWSWSCASEDSTFSFPSSLVHPTADVRVVAPFTRKSMDLGNRWSYLGNTGKLVPAHWKEFFTRLSVEIPTAEEQLSNENTEKRFTNEDIKRMKSCLPNLESTDV